MWQDIINSEITFWVLLTADVVMIGFGIVGAVYYVNDHLKQRKIISERMAYLKHLESFKK